MKINKDMVKERLAHVPEHKRSHIYDASIVLEFLAQTFMPTRYFLPTWFSPEPGKPLGQKSMRAVAEGKDMTIGDLYNLYQLFREEKDYTAAIESKYVFGIIVRNLRFYKNGWEFVFWRVGAAQIWHMGPLVIRKDMPKDVLERFSPKLEDKRVEAMTVEADPVTEPEDDEPVSTFVEAAPGYEPTEEADRFQEAQYELPEEELEAPSTGEGY